MTDVYRNMVVPASLAPLARALAAGMSPGGVGMFTTALSATGKEPATHYVSSGMIGEEFAAVMESGELLHAAVLKGGGKVSLSACNALIAQSDVADGAQLVDDKSVSEGPFESMARLGLQMMKGDSP